MKTPAEFLFLGTGGSMGVPVIGCACAVCRSPSPYNKRTRPSGLLTVGETRILIDSGTDLREQALKYRIDAIDGVLLTHAHHDHTAGIDELRAFYIKKREPIACLMSRATFGEMETRYHYIFGKNPSHDRLTSQLDVRLLEGDTGSVDFLGLKIAFVTFEQAGMQVTGFRCGNFAYISDIKEYKESIFENLSGVEVLVLSALRNTPSHLHLTVSEAIAFAEKVGAKETYLTHISHELDHEKTNESLPSNIHMAYDGLPIACEAEYATGSNSPH